MYHWMCKNELMSSVANYKGTYTVTIEKYEYRVLKISGWKSQEEGYISGMLPQGVARRLNVPSVISELTKQ